MMSKNRKPTAHQIRQDQVRARIKKVLAKMPEPRRRGGLTRSGVFAERAWKVATERGIPISRQVDKTATGIPGDLSASITNFVLGNYGAHEKRLDVYEVTCLEFEQEFRQEREEARNHLRVAPGATEVPEAATALDDEPLTYHMGDCANVQKGPVAQPTTGYTPPLTEFDAAKVINEVLLDFDNRTALRILGYMNTYIRQRGDNDGA